MFPICAAAAIWRYVYVVYARLCSGESGRARILYATPSSRRCAAGPYEPRVPKLTRANDTRSKSSLSFPRYYSLSRPSSRAWLCSGKPRIAWSASYEQLSHPSDLTLAASRLRTGGLSPRKANNND